MTFNHVFDHACKEGIIRDRSCYPPFDQVLEAAMKGEFRAGSTGSGRDKKMTNIETNGNALLGISVEVQPRFESSEGLPDERERGASVELPPIVTHLARANSQHHIIDEVSRDFARPRRRAKGPQQYYTCNRPGCGKSYRYVHHLNAHTSSKHDTRRQPQGKSNTSHKRQIEPIDRISSRWLSDRRSRLFART